MKLTRRRFLFAAAVATVGLFWARRWDAITIHHSAGGSGDLELLRKVRDQRQPRDPIPMVSYHFVIGNGRGMDDGEIAKTGRWKSKLWGAHLSSRNTLGNVRSIGICLIGNFEHYPPSAAQLDSLEILVRNLLRQYAIPNERVLGHGETALEQTKCPGSQFDLNAFRARLV